MKYLSALLLGFFLFCISSQVSAQPELSLKKILEQQSDKKIKKASTTSLTDDSSNLLSTTRTNTLTNNQPQDDLNRGTPQGAIRGYLNAVKNNDFQLASEYLDFRNISSSTLAVGKAELAQQLIIILDRTLWIDVENVSVKAQGNLADNLPSYRDSLGRIAYKDGYITMLLQRVPRKGDKVKIWKISNATVEKIPVLFSVYSYSPIGEWMSSHLPDVSFLDVQLWQWLYFTLALIFYYIIARIITWFIALFTKRIYPSTSSFTLRFIQGPFALLLAVLIAKNFRTESNVTFAVQAIADGGTLLTVAWIWVSFRFVDLMKIHLAERFQRQDKPLAIYLLRPAGTVVKLIVVIIGLLSWLENLGFNASTLLAGLGIGGLAVALAAQKTVENIIGAITLYTSAPVRIGDFCRFGDQYGVVEEIGLRSTRIRTLDRTVIYVANAQFIDMKIENYSEREKMAFRPKLYLSPNCKEAQVNAFLIALHDYLAKQNCVAQEPLRAHFRGYSAMGLKIEILSYINTTNFDVYLQEINQLNLAILALLERHDCKLNVITNSSLPDVQVSF